ncbi:MAG: MFS transporter [Nanoarchaeota archaeon]|nr:MFS transporter [Nanoarchaeota archaeon]
MGHLLKRGKLLRFHFDIGGLALVAILITFSASFVDTIWAIYLDSYLDNPSYVGFFSAVLTLISFVSFFWYIPMIEKNDKDKLFIGALILSIFSYIMFAFIKNVYAVFFIALLLTLAVNLRIAAFGIIVKDKSKKKDLAKNEGVLYSVYNTGWLLGPPVVGFIASKFDYMGVFIGAAFFLALALYFFWMFHIVDHNKKSHIDGHLWKNFIDFFKKKDRVVAYILGGGVNFWWVLIYLYMPLYLTRQGFDLWWLSGFFVLVLLPAVVFPYPFAKLSSKIGCRKIFVIGYSILALSALICFTLSNIYWIFGVLVFASVGIAMLEATTEAYFFDVSKDGEAYRFYAPYNTTIDANHLVAKFVPSLLLIFLPFKSVFILFAIFMAGFALVSLKAKNIIESKRKN